jgi:SAM-dependent methyltransferase
MSFQVTADAYHQFMGRYSEPLARQFVALVGARRGQRALDVGAGPGALTAALVETLGDDAVSAVEPSAPFVQALRARLPTVDARLAPAEAIPFPDDAFDLVLAQLVVHFMKDPVAGLTEMARVTMPTGTVAASVWDHAGGRGPLALFWRAARDLDPTVHDESDLAGAREGHLVELFGAAGLREVRGGALTVTIPYSDFDDWWRPYTLGVGPAGSYVDSLDPDRREALRRHCQQLLPPGPGVVEAIAWTAVGTVAGRPHDH